jgi:hypothetical protein
MIKKLQFIILILFSIISWSQKTNQNDFSILINGNKVGTAGSYKQQAEVIRTNAKRKGSIKAGYMLLQFSKIPTVSEQKELENQGITLLSYLSNNAYYVSVNSKFYNSSSVARNVRSFVEFDPNFKIDQTIASGAIPDYAKSGNSVKVVVSYFKGVDKTTISNDLAQIGVKDLKNMESFYQLYLQAPIEKLEEIAKFNWVQNIELIPPPVESENLPGVTSHKANVLGSAIPGLGYNLTGKGVRMGIWDGNLEKHIDHTGRVINREYEVPDSHGSHVSGTVGGAGILDPRAKGMAPEVQIYGWNFNTQSNGLPVHVERDFAAANDGVEITSNSYGFPLATGYNTVRYGVSDRGDDDVTVKYPYLLHVYSNGNSQTANVGGFNTSTKASKNALHVAANDPNDVISTYSSFGPTLDGRLVPQISAVGSSVYSLDYNNSYRVTSGTSMSTPGTSGTLALLYERYKNIFGARPLASLMKALVSNTAKDVGNAGPDYKYGFGNLNGLRAVKVLDNKMFHTGSVSNGASFEKDIVVPAGLTTLKVMLAYSDIGATPGAAAISVNDLDIKIVRGGVTILPWILNPSTPDAIATRGVDNLNNIEQITIDQPTAGTYKIIVTGTAVPMNSQEFSVVYDYIVSELILTYPIGGEKFNPDVTEFIRWDYEGEVRTFNIEYSNDGGSTYTTIAANVPSAARNFSWRVPAGVVPNAKIRISAGSRVAVSKENFTIMTEPKNLVIARALCGGTAYKMDWDAIAGAKYEVLKLNGFKFDLVATVTDPTYTFTNLTVGDNNWFTVRAVDIATNLVSQRSRAINVEPIASPVLTALNLPLLENFNDRKPSSYTLSRASATGTIGFESQSLALLDAVKMSGSSVAGSPLWAASTVTNAFTNNPNYIKRLSFCEVDATSLAGKAVRLKFNLIWNSSTATNRNFFRVLVNGVPVTSATNIAVYGGTVASANTAVTYDLAGVAGTKFSVTFEGVMDNNSTGGTNPIFNTIFVDNVEIFEAVANDLAITALITNTGFTAAETVRASVYNFSPVAVSNVPVSYKINDGAEVVETIAGPIAPLTEVTHTFAQTANFSVGGLYTVIGKIAPLNDADSTNNTLTRTVSNIGTDVLIGGATPVITCSAVFTDSGSRFGNYANNLNQTITFRPATAGNSVKVDFTEFATEATYDFLFVFNGPLVTSPLLGRYDGNSLPPSLTSTATGGELTFRFTSDTEIVDKGWVANISCVARPTVNDTEITSIITPEFLGRKTATNAITISVNNLGSTARTNVPVFYQVNGQTKIVGVVPSIAALTAVPFTFLTTADLSVVDATYTIRAGIDEIDGNVNNNILEKVVFNKNALPTNTNTNGFAITSLRWNDIVNNSGTTAYSDFKNIKIPVYAGFTYQPQVTISKVERPITRDLSVTPGVFSMIVIDLNGDGNLTDEFYAGTFWVNTLNTAVAPAILSTTSTHNFRNSFNLTGGLTIPTATTAGEKLMRVIHMFRSPNEFYNVNLGPTIDGLTTSRGDFEIEEYTINVLPFTAADASVERITAPLKPGKRPVIVSADIRNFSNTAISNFPVAYKVNGGTEVVQTVTASIAAGATANVVFATRADVSVPGEYTVEVYTKLVGDTDITNDSKSIALSHVPNASTNVTGTFDGINDYIVSDITPALDLTNNYTFEAWVNRKSPTVFGRILDKLRVNLFVHTNSNLTLYRENSLVLSITTATGSYVLNTGLNSMQLNKWQHIALTVSATNVYTIYIDGVVAPFIATGTAAAAITNATLPAFIGNNAALNRGLDANIDEVRIWSGVRDQATIAANTMTKYTGNEPNLLAYYSFSEGDKQFVFDSAPNDNTAVVTNADTNGIGEGKFWNTPVLLQDLRLQNQLSSAYDPASRTYTILLNDGVNITTAVSEFTAGMNSIAKVNGVTQVSGITANNFTNPVTFTVEGVGFNTGITEIYTIKVLSGLNSESNLLTYNFKTAANAGLNQEITTVISGANALAIVPFGINVSQLKADFSLSPGAELFIDNVKQTSGTNEVDYSNSILVTVVSENKLARTNYMVTVDAKNTEAKFLNYTVLNQFSPTVIAEMGRTVKVMVNNNATLSALIPVFQVSQNATTTIGTYRQDSGETKLNYTAPVDYNIMAQNGTFQKWTVTIERAKPVISLLGNQVVSLSAGCAYVEAGFSAIDNLNKNITSMVLTSGTLNVNVVGQYVLTYRVADDLNNESFVTRTINVLANQKPVITATANVIVNSASTLCGAMVVVQNATATDDCAVGTPVGLRSDGLGLNTLYPVGITTIRWNVNDNLGNAAVEVLQTVTVEDKVLPIVFTKNITVQLDASSNVTIAVAAINNGSTDNCAIRVIELDKTTFNCANLGNNTVTLKVTDVNGNVAFGTATVTVVDSQPNLIRRHFDDVIFFDNSSNSFKGYSWYKNGVLVSGQTAQYYKDSASLNGTYYAVATKLDGTVVTTCPLTFSPSVEQEFLRIAPNPVRSNAAYQINTNVNSAKIQNAQVMVFNILGTVITNHVIDKNTIDMVAPSAEGVYIVKLTLANGKIFTKNLLVKN